jgi:hypothetical protein
MKKAGMNNSGEAIEKVLAGLRDADAPAGMERRILAGLEERAAPRSRSGWRQLLPVWVIAPAGPVAVGSLVCGAVVAGVFVIAFAIPAIRRSGQTAEQGTRNSVVVGATALAASEAAPESARSSLRPGGRVTGQREVERSATGAEAVGEGDSAALEEMHAASYPAPPMPLTEQERLLLRLVHKDDPVELAMLDPKLRALQDSEDKAEFQRFFGRSTKQTTPEQPTTESVAAQQSATEQIEPGQSTSDPATTAPATTGPATTEQAMPAQPGTEQSVPGQSIPEQPVPEQPVPEQPTQPQATPKTVAPDQSITRQATPEPTRTGDKE